MFETVRLRPLQKGKRVAQAALRRGGGSHRLEPQRPTREGGRLTSDVVQLSGRRQGISILRFPDTLPFPFLPFWRLKSPSVEINAAPYTQKEIKLGTDRRSGEIRWRYR